MLGERYGSVVQQIRYGRDFSKRRAIIFVSSFFYRRLLIVVITLYYYDRPITNVFLNVGLQSLYLIMLLETNIFDNNLDRFKILAGEYFVTLMTFVLLMSTGDFLTGKEQQAYLGQGCVYASIANLALFGGLALLDILYSVKHKIKTRAL